MMWKAGNGSMARVAMPAVVLAALTLRLAGCSGPPPRDYDELIGKLMGAIAGKTPEEAAAKLFDVTSPDERRDAIAYLQVKSYGHEAPYMRAYELLAEDKYSMVRAQALRALGTSGQPEADLGVRPGKKVVDYLVAGLKDGEVQVRRDAAQGLMTTWGDAAAGPVVELLTKADEDDQVRVFCAQALSRAREPDAYWALIGALRDRDAAVAWYARESLAAATKEDFGFDPKAWMGWYSRTYVNTGTGGAGGAGVTAPTTGTRP
jgi:hypothetical protein